MSQDLLKYHTALITNACGFGEGFQVYHTWKNMEGRRIIPILSYDGRQTFVQTSFTAGTVWVPHCVSNMNTHGPLKLALLCFKHECTWSGVRMCLNLEYTRSHKTEFTVLLTKHHFVEYGLPVSRLLMKSSKIVFAFKYERQFAQFRLSEPYMMYGLW
jgi:hypothetical protein